MVKESSQDYVTTNRLAGDQTKIITVMPAWLFVQTPQQAFCNNLLQKRSVLGHWCHTIVKLVSGEMCKLEMQ